MVVALGLPLEVATPEHRAGFLADEHMVDAEKAEVVQQIIRQRVQPAGVHVPSGVGGSVLLIAVPVEETVDDARRPQTGVSRRIDVRREETVLVIQVPIPIVVVDRGDCGYCCPESQRGGRPSSPSTGRNRGVVRGARRSRAKRSRPVVGCTCSPEAQHSGGCRLRPPHRPAPGAGDDTTSGFPLLSSQY